MCQIPEQMYKKSERQYSKEWDNGFFEGGVWGFFAGLALYFIFELVMKLI